MRPSVLAVSVAAALLMPGAAALADPSWERGHEYEAGGCKYEYKGGPGGFNEEHKCDGGGPRYAGGPPPWAPAHGWRRKHAQQYEAGYVIPDLGIEFGRCNRDVMGAVIGGAAGGAIGSQVGKGSKRTVATIGGTIAGVLIGGAIGRSMDQADAWRRRWSRRRRSTRSRGATPTAGNIASCRWRVTRTARGTSAATTALPPPLGGASRRSMVRPAGSPMGAGSG